MATVRPRRRDTVRSRALQPRPAFVSQRLTTVRPRRLVMVRSEARQPGPPFVSQTRHSLRRAQWEHRQLPRPLILHYSTPYCDALVNSTTVTSTIVNSADAQMSHLCEKTGKRWGGKNNQNANKKPKSNGKKSTLEKGINYGKHHGRLEHLQQRTARDAGRHDQKVGRRIRSAGASGLLAKRSSDDVQAATSGATDG